MAAAQAMELALEPVVAQVEMFTEFSVAVTLGALVIDRRPSDRGGVRGNARTKLAFKLSGMLPTSIVDQILNFTVQANPYLMTLNIQLGFKNQIWVRFREDQLDDPAVVTKIALAATASFREKPQMLVDL